MKKLLAYAGGAALAAALVAAVRDYRAWVALGEGGVPHGLRGWITVKRGYWSMSDDTTDTSTFEPGHPSAILDGLPVRSEARPRIAPWSVPQREADFNATRSILSQLNELIESELLERAHDGVWESTSLYEKHFVGLFAKDLRERGESVSGEVVHVHQPQGSLHVHLSAGDARVVIERGWGERHGLAVLGRVPKYYVFLYVPRDEEQLQAVKLIVRAALDAAAPRSTPDQP